MASLVVLSDGRLASGGSFGDCTIRVWDLGSGTCDLGSGTCDLGSGTCDLVLQGHTWVREGGWCVYCKYARMTMLIDRISIKGYPV